MCFPGELSGTEALASAEPPECGAPVRKGSATLRTAKSRTQLPLETCGSACLLLGSCLDLI